MRPFDWREPRRPKALTMSLGTVTLGAVTRLLQGCLLFFLLLTGCGDSPTGGGSGDGGEVLDGGPVDGFVRDGTTSDGGPVCGNGKLETNETCDGSQLGGMSCADVGFETGELRCRADCTWDTSLCGLFCGNGEINSGEDCDGDNLEGMTCQDLGFGAGVLSCREDCSWDLTSCPGCGNGVKELGEGCDGEDFGTLSCNGDLACTEDCHLDVTGCLPPELGDGADGSLEVTEFLNLSESWAPSYTVVALGGDSATLESTPLGVSPGDEVLLINLQGSFGACESVGRNEFKQVSQVTADSVVFSSPVAGGYGVGGDNSDLTGQKVMVQRVPHFSDVQVRSGGVLTVSPWDGERGGVLALRVSGELLVEYGGRITVDGLGYRGGQGYTSSGEVDGRQGESICGDPQAVSTAPNHGGGGGGSFGAGADDPCGQGGGGGGYGGTGTWADYSSTCRDHGNGSPADNGGEVYGATDLLKVYLGSGGGGGATDDHSDDSGTGGHGGGVVLLAAQKLSVAGTLEARGGWGGAGDDTSDSGNGGGGSGGTVKLWVGVLEGSGLVLAHGGVGLPSQGSWNNAGGDGGTGRVRVEYAKAGGYLYGRPNAEIYVGNLSFPPPGETDIFY